MSLNIIKLEDQARGQFNGGAILENKPIGFPQDGGRQRPYSNLFYWAHAWTPGEKSLIGEHPHQGFEIMSFVLKGSIEHYDSKNRDWRQLNLGDAQIIRAGSGITHAEWVHKKSEFFQIWLDPDLNVTLGKEPSYNDYLSESFPVVSGDGYQTKIYKGEGAPMEMSTPGVRIWETGYEAGPHKLDLDPVKLYSIYLMDGEVEMNTHEVRTRDYVIIEEKKELVLRSDHPFRIFVIESPVKLDYKTYAEHIRY